MTYLKLLALFGAILIAVSAFITQGLADGIGVLGLECIALSLIWTASGMSL